MRRTQRSHRAATGGQLDRCAGEIRRASRFATTLFRWMCIDKTYYLALSPMRDFKLPIVLAGFLTLANACFGGSTSATTVSLSAFTGDEEVAPTPIQVNGQETKVWQTSPQSHELTFRVEGSTVAPSSGILYLQVTYLDRGYGRLSVHYKESDGKTTKPDKYTRMVLSDSG